MAPRRLVLWGLASTLLAIATVVHAFRMRSNFYAAAVYLAKSNACTMVSRDCVDVDPPSTSRN
jgi:hypothetical protein